MQHQMTDHSAIEKFIFGGKSEFTLVSNKTGKHLSYKVRVSKFSDTVFFVSCLHDHAEDNDYAYVGHLKTHPIISKLNTTTKSKFAVNSRVFKSFEYFLEKLENEVPFEKAKMKFMHSGRCCRCARKLTSPASIDSGIGPECMKAMN